MLIIKINRFCVLVREREALARSQPSLPTVRPTAPVTGGMGSSPPPGDPGLPKSPAMSYSQVAISGSRDLEEKFSNVVRYSPVADLQGGVAYVDLPEELLSDSKPLWSAYIVGHFMGDASHIGNVHACQQDLVFPGQACKD